MDYKFVLPRSDNVAYWEFFVLGMPIFGCLYTQPASFDL